MIRATAYVQCSFSNSSVLAYDDYIGTLGGNGEEAPHRMAPDGQSGVPRLQREVSGRPGPCAEEPHTQR